MKKTLCVLLLAFCLSVTAQAATNSVAIAEAVLGHQVSHYNGDFQGIYVAPDGIRRNLVGTFKMNANKEFVSLVIDGESLAVPTKTIKLPESGVIEGFQVWVEAFDYENLAYSFAAGNFYRPVLLPQDVISVMLHLWGEEIIIPFNASGYSPSHLAIRFDGQTNIGWYDTELGGFRVYFEPGSSNSYEIFNLQTGEIIATGTLEGEVSSGKAINIGYEGGVLDLFPREQEAIYQVAQFNELWPDGTVDGKYDWAKVCMARLNGRGLFISAYPLYPVQLRLRVWGIIGDQKYELWNRPDENPYFQVPDGYDSVIVAISGLEGEPFTTFNLSASRWWVGGGGKG